MNLPIKKLLVLVALLMGVPALGMAEADFFRDGVVAYEAGRYESAAHSFQASLDKHVFAGTLLNLGLAEWQQGHTGEAIAAWEQSAWLNPFDPGARINLSQARERAGLDPLELTRCEIASTWLPPGLWAGIATLSLWLAVAMVTLPEFFRRRKAGWHQTLSALALGLFLLSLAPNIGVLTRANTGILTGKNTSLRRTPTPSGEVVATLAAGESCRRLRVRGDDWLVHTRRGNGWIERQQAQLLCVE